MVPPLILILLVSLFLSGSAQAELQLNPTVAELEGDGIKYHLLAFKDGDKNVTYRAPNGWTYVGGSTQLTLHPPGKPQAEAIVTRTPLAEPQPFDEKQLENLVNQALSFAPKGGENVTLISQERNPLIINRKETFLVTFKYMVFGQSYTRSVLFMNRGKEQMRFELVSRTEDFKDLQGAFFHSQFSWENL